MRAMKERTERTASRLPMDAALRQQQMHAVAANTPSDATPLLQHLSAEMIDAMRDERALAVLRLRLPQVDGAKTDNALRKRSAMLKQLARNLRCDRYGLHGPDDIVIVLPGADADGAAATGKRLMALFAQKKLIERNSTMGFFYAALRATDADPIALITRAERTDA